MPAAFVRGLRRAVGALGAAASLAGCYVYAAPMEVQPALGRTFAFEFTDQGRAALAVRVGPGIDRIEGVLLALTDSTYDVRVARTVDIRGTVVSWSGEVVSLGRQYIGTVRERRVSALRTGMAAGGAAAGVAALVAIATIDVIGREGNTPPGEQPPPTQDSRIFPLTLHRSR
jgi:hypothetical protein